MLNSTFLLSVIIGSFAIEFATIGFRIITHLESAPLQKKIRLPRTHHGYVGLLILLLYFFVFKHIGILAVAITLILSDITHHLVVIPLLKIGKIDRGMSFHHTFHLSLDYFLIVAFPAIILGYSFSLILR